MCRPRILKKLCFLRVTAHGMCLLRCCVERYCGFDQTHAPVDCSGYGCMGWKIGEDQPLWATETKAFHSCAAGMGQSIPCFFRRIFRNSHFFPLTGIFHNVGLRWVWPVPPIFRDVDTSVHSHSTSSTRDKGKLIARSGRKTMDPKSNRNLDRQVTERECLTTLLLVL